MIGEIIYEGKVYWKLSDRTTSEQLDKFRSGRMLNFPKRRREGRS